jgi:hypothetical protein
MAVLGLGNGFHHVGERESQVNWIKSLSSHSLSIPFLHFFPLIAYLSLPVLGYIVSCNLLVPVCSLAIRLAMPWTLLGSARKKTQMYLWLHDTMVTATNNYPILFYFPNLSHPKRASNELNLEMGECYLNIQLLYSFIMSLYPARKTFDFLSSDI